MNGREQANAMAKLAGSWQPDSLAGIKVGDLVDLPTLGRCEVVALLPPSLLKLRNGTGAEFKAGWRQCQKVTP